MMNDVYDQYGPIRGLDSHVPDSCSKDDAIRYLIYWVEGIVLPFYVLSEEPTEHELEHCYYFSVEENLIDAVDIEDDQWFDAKEGNLAPEDIAQKLAKRDHQKLLLKKYHAYRRYLIDELSKSDESVLRIDPFVTEPRKGPYITSISLMQWIPVLKRILKKDVDSTKLEPQLSSEDKPWLVPDTTDPEAVEPWYIPARYFARQLIKYDPKLLEKRGLLAEKVAEQLTHNGIHKRGGKSPLNSSTVRKAFSNVKFE